MNITFAISLIIVCFIFAEILGWTVRKDTKFIFGYISLIRIIVICLSVCAILCISKSQDKYKFLQDANSFKYELLQHQDSLINLQHDMIKDLSNHLWQEHDCDVPQFDGDLYQNIQEQENILDSLYNTQL